ncbi:MAG: hypothetical protein P1S60_00370 [Anaerolineae bacterium]|nr:hypothetical protein [Anaerolineae bacterium]
MDAVMALYESCSMWCKQMNRLGIKKAALRRGSNPYGRPANLSLFSMFLPRY